MSELIAAVATGEGKTAIGIVRLSGSGALSAVSALFSPQNGIPFSSQPSHKLIYGKLYDENGKLLDTALATWSPAGHSYTGEETAELQCHGSPMGLHLTLKALFSKGARQALPGEFTRRAYLNGALDLTQAEAVMDLIDAKSPVAAHVAARQLDGSVSEEIENIYDCLVNLSAHFCAVLDYPDEDLDPFTVETMRKGIREARVRLEKLADSYKTVGSLLGGIPCVMVGRPNVGKSTLLNALLGYERAIVTEIPGTTRDTVEEGIYLGDRYLRIIDTAGIREKTSDKAEQYGIERTVRSMEKAKLILVLWDNSSPHTEEDTAIIREAVSLAPTVLVRTKTDLPTSEDALCSPPGIAGDVRISALTGDGMTDLKEVILSSLPAEDDTLSVLLTNDRQASAADCAGKALFRAEDALREGITPDAVMVDIEESMNALGSLTGKVVREDVTDRIVSRFCVGK